MERVYVVASAADAFLNELVTQARGWEDRIGPLVDRKQRSFVQSRPGAAR